MGPGVSRRRGGPQHTLRHRETQRRKEGPARAADGSEWLECGQGPGARSRPGRAGLHPPRSPPGTDQDQPRSGGLA